MKRAELLDAASKVIAEEGFAAASLRRVAHRAGYTTGAVTYYFKNKEDLTLALAESRFERYFDLLDSATQSDLHAPLRSLIAAATEEQAFPLVMSQLLANAQQGTPLGKLISGRYAKFRKRLTTSLADGQRNGLVRDDIPADILAEHLAAIADGIAVLVPIDPQRIDRARAEEIFNGMVKLVSPA